MFPLRLSLLPTHNFLPLLPFPIFPAFLFLFLFLASCLSPSLPAFQQFQMTSPEHEHARSSFYVVCFWRSSEFLSSESCVPFSSFGKSEHVWLLHVSSVLFVFILWSLSFECKLRYEGFVSYRPDPLRVGQVPLPILRWRNERTSERYLTSDRPRPGVLSLVPYSGLSVYLRRPRTDIGHWANAGLCGFRWVDIAVCLG